MRSPLRAVLSLATTRLATTLGLLLAAGALLPLGARAQVATDFPNLKGGNARTGSAGDPANAAIGNLRSANNLFPDGSLRWFQGGANYGFGEVVVDNTDDAPGSPQVNEDGTAANPYEPNPRGIVARNGNPLGGINPRFGWSYITDNDVDNGAAEAQFLYVPNRANRNFTVPFGMPPVPTTFPTNFSPRTPRYEYTATTISSTNRVNGRLDPRLAADPNALKTFAWNLTPTSTNPQNLALYAWIPEGLTGNPALPRQRYFVYEITYGTGQKYVDVVDTDLAGVGFVRLGAGGRPTDQVFPYAGVNTATNLPYPVTITLYNTVPRNERDNTPTSPPGKTLVYADAVKFSAYVDTIFATPTSAGFLAGDVRTIGARNENGLLASVGNNPFLPPASLQRGTVTSHDYNTGLARWTYTPDFNLLNNPVFDNGSAAFTPSSGFTVKASGAPNAVTSYGADYLSAQTTVGAGFTEQVEVRPGAALGEGDYEISMYLNGGAGAELPGGFATAARYEIFENGLSQGIFTLNESGARGFVRLGNRRYRYVPANVGAGVTEQPLYVLFYNNSLVAGDSGTNVAVDAVRFNGSLGTRVTSTPVHATALIRQTPTGAPVDTNVVLVADESGRISCLDATGNADGTTKVYWTYPSTPDVPGFDAAGLPNYQDPNTNAGGPENGFDGTGNIQSAELPPSFNLSTAVVQRTQVGTAGATVPRDFLIIGGSNGRVYSIAMEGRGDSTVTAPGTTFRRWTFPQSYPLFAATRLGQITSVVSGTPNGATNPLVYVGTEAGRMFALDANGDGTTFNPTRTTAQRWQFPAANNQLVGAIVGAPALDVAGNRLFFGTVGNNVLSAALPSSLISLNATTGIQQWQQDRTSGFRSGPAYVPATELNAPLFAGGGILMPDTVYAMSDNNFVYAFNALTGDEIWRTNELQGGGRGSLGYARTTTFSRNGSTGLFPIITVPTEGGRFAALFARLGDETNFSTIGDPLGNRQAWGSRIDAPIIASMTNASNGTANQGFLYGASTNGFLFAWSDAILGGGGGGGFPYYPPITEDVTDNNDDADVAQYRNAKVALLSKQGFVNLRRTLAGTNTSQFNYTDVIAPGAYANPFGTLKLPFRSNRPVDATGLAGYEWGETIYLIVYDFVAPEVNSNGAAVAPPVVEVYVSTEGKAARPIVAEARIFKDRAAGATADTAYAVVQIPITSGGQTAFPPGDGILKVALRTSANNPNFIPQAISLRPTQSLIRFTVANPIGLAMTDPFTGNLLSGNYQIGFTNNATDPDRVNGSPNVVNPAYPTRNASLLQQSFGSVQHGQSKKTSIAVYDRSLMTLLRGPGRGLDNIRVDRRDLEWQGGAATVEKPFVGSYGALFAKFEDLPVNTPNTSLDYPDIRRERVTVTKDPDGAAENPLFGGVGLKAPIASGGGAVDDTSAPTRVLQVTPFQFTLDTPKYQPPSYLERNTSALVADSAGNTDARLQGYGGRFSIYVDSDGNGSFAPNREAYRGFNLFGKILADERLTTVTPTVDLGAVAAGTGYDSGLTYTNAAPYRTLAPGTIYSPWVGPYAGLFKPFTARNEGNVNLLNVRLAKGTEDGTLRYPWQITSVLNDETATWLDGSLDLWSDLDKTFAPYWQAGRNEVIAPKPRVGDLQGREIQANPIARFNANLDAQLAAAGSPDRTGTALFDPTNFPAREPRVGVTIPLGFPVGPYVQTLRLIEDSRQGNLPTNNDELLSLSYSSGGRVDPQETYADPGLRLAFTVTETQLTGDFNVAGAPGSKMVDAGTPITPANPTGYASRQPAAVRAGNGSVAMVFASNRPLFEPVTGTNPGQAQAYRLWVTSLAGDPPGNRQANFTPDSQTRDLNKFTPSGATGGFWSQQGTAYPNGTAASRFGDTDGATGTPVEGSQTYGNPALPTAGFTDPIGYGDPNATVFPSTTLAFVGSVFRDGTTGRTTDSRIFVASLSLAGDGSTTLSEPVSLNYDPLSRKGKPAVVRSNASGGLGATIVYPATSGNATSLFITRYTDGSGFTKPLALNLGNAFESATDPSATIRNYSTTGQVLDLVFSGRLRGRGGNEIFQMSLVLGPDHLPVTPIRYIYFRVRGERASLDPSSGTYRVRGAYLREPGPDPVSGFPNAQYDDRIFLRGTTADLRPANGPNDVITNLPTRIPERDYRTDRETRIESSASPTLGGQIYLDRGAGSFRVVGGVLPRSRDVLVDYDSVLLRVSGNEGAGYSSPVLLRDARLAPSNSTGTADAYWFQPNGNPSPPGATDTFSDRTYLLFTRAAQPGGQATRPFSASYRIGTRIGFTLATNADGTLADTVAVTGSVGPYQVDPAEGRVYFTRADEGNVVSITVNGTNYPNIPIGFVSERAEQAVLLGRAVNEANLTAFLDPVFNQPGESFERRNLMWMFWTSTRGGTPNIFMQTLAPKLIPFIPSP